MSVTVRLSILIPSYNRRASLVRLLESLVSGERMNFEEIEILVLDNGSTDGTASTIEQWRAGKRHLALRYLEERRKGKAHALNLGLREAHGAVIMILDDDVVAAPDCLAKHLEAHRTTVFDALQGKILPGRDAAGNSAEMSRLAEYNIPHIDYGHEIHPLRGLTGTNMSFKRGVFENVGFFDTRLGPGAAGFSEDTEYSMRIRKAGFKIGYTPHAVVYHELNPNRYGRAYNRMVEYRKGLSRSIYRHDSIAFRVLPNLFANCARYGLYRLLGKTQKAYKTEGRIAKCCGYLMGKIRGVRSHDRHSEV
ncbi:MAG: glycosyltransferase family 2 protein [Deltaproteobacteria bacterium]|nr:glycosyltransferase family 2 protein [Deltaproteobacteria bacterium]